MGKSTISMVIFNSYVKLPEGTWSPHNQLEMDQEIVAKSTSEAGWSICKVLYGTRCLWLIFWNPECNRLMLLF